MTDSDKNVALLMTVLVTRQLNTLILLFRLGRNLSLNSFCNAVRSPTSEDDGLRYFVAELLVIFAVPIHACLLSTTESRQKIILLLFVVSGHGQSAR